MDVLFRAVSSWVRTARRPASKKGLDSGRNRRGIGRSAEAHEEERRFGFLFSAILEEAKAHSAK
jgi:hypothetical protein